MSTTIDKMAQQFKSISELQMYCDAQYQTIINLTKRINDLEAQKIHLEKLLSESTPIVKENASEIQLLAEGTDQETICRIQLKKLRDKSMNGEELTLEETKRVEIYTKLILSIEANQKKDPEDHSKKLDDGQLLTLIDGLK